MITLYDLVFQNDRRPSPFCWRAKFALAHKGLEWKDEPTGFTEKHKIAFADSQLLPVLKDGDVAVKDSWAIACHLDKAYPDKPIFASEQERLAGQLANGWTDVAINAAVFPLVVADLVERVRPEDQAYIIESRGKRLGPADFAGFQARAREKGVATLRTALEPARRVLREQKFLGGVRPNYADYALFGTFMWAYATSPLALLENDDPVHSWRERMFDQFDGMGRKAKAA